MKGSGCRKREYAPVVVTTVRVCLGVRSGPSCTRSVRVDATARTTTKTVCVDMATRAGCVRQGYWRGIRGTRYCSTSATSGTGCWVRGRTRTVTETRYVCSAGYRRIGAGCYKTVDAWSTRTSMRCPGGYTQEAYGRAISCYRYVTADPVPHTHPTTTTSTSTTTTTTTTTSTTTTTTTTSTTTTSTTTTTTLPEPDTDSDEPEPDTPEPDTDSDEPEPDTPEPDTDSDEPDTDSDEPEPDTPEPDTDSDEPDTDSDEPDTDSDEPDTDSDEPDTDSDEPDTDSDEPEPATPARVAITGLGDVSDVSPIDADFGVVPGDANCYAWQGSGPLSAPLPIPDDDGTQRSVRLDTGSAVGEVQVTVRCFSDGYAAARKTAVFTVVSPVVCELRITLGGARVGNVWVSSCKSSQHGDQTPYYAKRYTLTLAEAATVTVVAVSDHAIDVYVHDGDAGSAKPLHTASSPGGEARAATVSALLNPEGMVGRYTVEVARRADRNPGGFTLSVSAVNVCPSDQTYMSAFARGSDDGCRPRVCASPLFRNPADQRCRTAAYRYGAAIIDGVMSAARRVIDGNAGRECVTRDSDPVTANELAAYVLAIPIRELHKDNPSLMDLSRWDSLFTNDESTGLFSKGTQTGEPRAHWSPGVGPWQLDLWEPVKEWHHAKRANVNHAAVEVAKHLFGGLCASEEKLKKQLETWLACKAQKRFGEDPDINHCIPIAETIYDDANDALRVRRVAGSDPDGGVQDRRCRWGTGGEPFDCHWYDIANAEGGATVYHPDGRTRKHCKDAGCGTFEIWYDITPLPLGFVSFTDTDGTKYAAFPANDIGEAGTGTGYAETLIRGVPKNKYAREVGAGVGDGYGWFVNAVGTRVLYIKHCPTQGTCSWHRV